jgi:ArsR family transcriptional regulator, arsenate/arsenite/antimonite-responsive transcriptional repressor
MTPQAVEKVASAMADKNRLAILLELAKRSLMTNTDVIELIGLSQPCVSHHVKILTDSGLVDVHKDGRCLQLRLNKAGVQALATFLNELV